MKQLENEGIKIRDAQAALGGMGNAKWLCL
jgi:hypothetical protein